MKMILSKLSSPVSINGVVINGGCGVFSELTLSYNNDGVFTKLSDSDFDKIKDHHYFKEKVNQGYFAFNAKKSDAKNMATDNSTQLNDSDFDKETIRVELTNKKPVAE